MKRKSIYLLLFIIVLQIARAQKTGTLEEDAALPPCGINITIEPVSYCSGSSAVIQASFEMDNDLIATPVYSWAPATGLSSTSILNPTVSVATTTTYTLSIRVGRCRGSAKVTVQVNPTPSITGVTNGERCGPGAINLSATANTGTISWYSSLTDPTVITTGNTFTTPPVNVPPGVSTTVNYYVSASLNGCTSSPRTMVAGTVKVGGFVSSTIPASRCDHGSLILRAVGSGVLNWYDVATGGVTLAQTTSNQPFITPVLSATKTYYVESVNGACVSSPRTPVTATIGGPQFQYTSAGNGICGDQGQAMLTAMTSAGTVNWFATPAGGTSLFTGNTFQTPVITASTTYYAEASENGCITNPRLALTANVFKLNVSPFPETTINAGQTAQLTASTVNFSGNFSWQPTTGLNNSNMANPVAQPTATTTYTVSATGGPNGCVLTKAIKVNVSPVNLPAIANYAVLTKQLDDTYCQLGTDKKLHFKYINEYANSSSPLNYKIYNYNRIAIPALPTLTKIFGGNFYTVDLNAYSLNPNTMYYLEVISDKNDVYFLKFKTP